MLNRPIYIICFLLFSHICTTGASLRCNFESNEEEFDKLGILKAQVVYTVEFKMDSTDLGRVRKSKNVLSIGEGISVFECLVLKETREFAKSIGQNSPNFLQQLTEFTRGRNSIFNPMVVKRNKEQTITTTDKILFDFFEYTEPLGSQIWKVTGNEGSFMGYKIIEATTTYACRKWVAWFTTDIPISDGPYKFHGLPGLIVRVADTMGHYVFQFESIQFPDKKTGIEIPKDNPFRTTFQGFVKTRAERYRNPDALIGKLTSDPHTRAVAASNAARRNNFIELCAD